MLLPELKTATQSIHQELHRIVDLNQIQNSLDCYVRCLLGFAQAIIPLEYRLELHKAAALRESEDLGIAIKSSWLISDLSCFGFQRQHVARLFSEEESALLADFLDRLFSTSSSAPTPTLLPFTLSAETEQLLQEASRHSSITEDDLFLAKLLRTKCVSPAERIGIRYVMEGMTLGSTAIYPRIMDAHGLASTGSASELGFRFFRGYGDRAKTQLQWQRFCGWVNCQSSDHDQAITAAIGTFQRFATVLGTWIPSPESLLK